MLRKVFLRWYGLNKACRKKDTKLFHIYEYIRSVLAESRLI